MTLRRIAVPLIALAALAAPGLAHAAAFDVETATRAYLDTLQGAARAKSDAYFEGGYWLFLWGALVTFLADALLLRFRLSARFRDWAELRFKRRWMQVWAVALLYTLWGLIVTFPWAIYTDFVREHRCTDPATLRDVWTRVEADQRQPLAYVGVGVRFADDAVGNRAFGECIADRHARVERGEGVLENHLDARGRFDGARGIAHDGRA